MAIHFGTVGHGDAGQVEQFRELIKRRAIVVARFNKLSLLACLLLWLTV